ncbi:MAG TPA: tRNA dihydrouridine(20/20a) synthase DusA [Arenimonas sp.]|nr:tRNA dihydrouridine(20/20a) synthase DusA [Arenimonas sp.]HOZ05478.1 tRNA dihydrouridine(20/20a) synthase DusA [Arenimonas sp.]HPO24472.1 tRNA dihydrouridine(20/20a) synthase DusA [Arenimonas sp.]
MTTAYLESQTLSVAPMMDWTDTHCRSFHRILAPHALLYTEMVHAQAVIHGDRDRLLGFDQGEHPLALQLGGSDRLQLAEASRIGEQWGYDEINLNVGCPSDRVQAGRFGACLMKEPALVADCIGAMIAAVKIPVTVKCRLGVDELETYEHFTDFIDTVAKTGCNTFVVHARKAWLSGLSPKENREIPPLRYDWVYELKKQRPHLKVLLNGGLSTVEASLESLPRVDGVMIGRMAYHEPYRLHLLDHAIYTSHLPVETREALLMKYRPYVEAQCSHGIAVKHMTRHILGLFHSQPGGRMFRQVLSEKAHRAQGWEVIEEALQATKI